MCDDLIKSMFVIMGIGLFFISGMWTLPIVIVYIILMGIKELIKKILTIFKFQCKNKLRT
jgi:hypothetical protein